MAPTEARLLEAAPGLLRTALAGGGRYADAFAEATLVHTASWRQRLRRGRLDVPVRQTHRAEIAGCGLRALAGDAVAFASADSLDPANWKAAARTVGAQHFGAPQTVVAESSDPLRGPALPPDAPAGVADTERLALLEALADAAFALDERVVEVHVRYRDRQRHTAVATSAGERTMQATALVEVRAEVTLQAEGGPVTSCTVAGSTGGFGALWTVTPPEAVAAAAVRQAQARAAARPWGARTVPVVLGAGWGGVWLHEVIGHLLEADVAAAQGWLDRVGDQVAGRAVTVIDDPRQPGGRGAMTADDEGLPAQRSLLVEDGVLCGFLTDRRAAARHDLPRTGNGRRQDYRYAPLPRMTNLMLRAGPADPGDLIADVEDGLYVTAVGGGRTDPSTGRYAVAVLGGRRIEHGRLTTPVCDVRLEGDLADALGQLRGVADDALLDTARGDCVKAGQHVPVSVGMPTVLLGGCMVTPGW